MSENSTAGDSAFDFDRAFSRNLGLMQPDEQQKIRSARVAIPGLGGVGGAHLLTLARMGVANFTIADFDVFELHNFNRQAGATLSALHRPKAEVMDQLVRDINPDADIRIFGEGINANNIDAFLEGVDVVIDGLDFFAVEARQILHAACWDKGIPAVMAGPIGASTAYIVFQPGHMSWHDYFAMDLATNITEKFILFAIGNAPAGTHVSYMDAKYVRLDEKRGPSLSLAVQLCSGAAAGEAMKLILGRGKIYPAPWFHQYDVYKCLYVRRKLRWGNRGPMQRLKFKMLRKYYT
ncbi:MAG: ThiF family adenylyltransferase [Chromatiales bacterium]|nr:ThiF family adenylyltransferase [Chromatiales bacterium]